MYLDHRITLKIARVLDMIDLSALLLDANGNVILPEGDQRVFNLPEPMRTNPTMPLEVPVVYTIELSNEKTARAIADETGVEICTFYSVQNVTEVDFSAGESYVSLMLKNVASLERGLN